MIAGQEPSREQMLRAISEPLRQQQSRRQPGPGRVLPVFVAAGAACASDKYMPSW